MRNSPSRKLGGDRGTPDHDLALLLERYAEQVRSGAEWEVAAASVERTARFTNRALSGSGHGIPIDEPAEFGGTGQAPDPAELLLAAAGASLSVTLTAYAAMRGISLEGVQMDLRTRMSADSFLRPDGGAPAGVQDLEIDLRLRSAAPPAALRRLARDAARGSPVVKSLKRAPRISLAIEEPSR